MLINGTTHSFISAADRSAAYRVVLHQHPENRNWRRDESYRARRSGSEVRETDSTELWEFGVLCWTKSLLGESTFVQASIKRVARVGVGMTCLGGLYT